MKAVLLPHLKDDRAVWHDKLDRRDVEDKYTKHQLIVVLLNIHVTHIESPPHLSRSRQLRTRIWGLLMNLFTPQAPLADPSLTCILLSLCSCY